jgi:hypothetical protein
VYYYYYYYCGGVGVGEGKKERKQENKRKQRQKRSPRLCVRVSARDCGGESFLVESSFLMKGK